MTLNHNYGCFSGVGSGIAGNVSRLCFVAEKEAKRLDLKTKLTNTNRTFS